MNRKVGPDMSDKKEEKVYELFSDVDGKFLVYRGRPLVREGNVICYGSMDEKYFLQMIIMTTKTVDGIEVPDKILLQLLNTDRSLPDHERIVKQDMKSGFNEAMDIGTIWLERYLAN